MSIGIIAGSGHLPILLARQAANMGIVPYVIVLEGYGNIHDFSEFQARVFKIGHVQAIIDFLKNVGVVRVSFAGKVQRPNWSSIHVDGAGRKLLGNIFKSKILGDNTVMEVISSFLQECGFSIMAPKELLGNSPEMVTKIKPTKEDLDDIDLGIKVMKLVGGLDIGQSVVVERGCVLAVEAAEGTDELIKRCAALRREACDSGVLIKGAKPMQSLKLDPPAIGPDTIKILHASGMKGLAFEKDSVVVLLPLDVMRLADEFGLFIYEYTY